MQNIPLKSFCKPANIRNQIFKEFYSNHVKVGWTNYWREKNGLPSNPTSFGPLTNLPDYSFKDGRPVPFGSNQKKRIDQQHANLLKIKQYVGQIDNAVLRYQEKQKEIEEQKQKIIDRKLKEKGNKLLKS